jgi:mono/diheme cytochrome c family protein
MSKGLLAICVALPIAAGFWAVPSAAADEPGQRIYEEKCSRCHGAEGRGGNAPRLVPFEWSDQRALDLIRRPECDMPPIPASEVSDADVAQIIAYLKTIK